ncbi:hypothetical protein BC937DRAFT_94363, partial [Endogone sp. FLAS-F59071]
PNHKTYTDSINIKFEAPLHSTSPSPSIPYPAPNIMSSPAVENALETVQQFADGPRQFFKEGVQFLNRCTKPDQKEFIQISKAVAMGFIALGALGYFVKVKTYLFSMLIHIPINNILVGAA